ncbi:hypothetical protein [Corynebacterium kalinowskii]|nr:hypothetical protein [Corynebacterium kalinowskii]
MSSTQVATPTARPTKVSPSLSPPTTTQEVTAGIPPALEPLFEDGGSELLMAVMIDGTETVDMKLIFDDSMRIASVEKLTVNGVDTQVPPESIELANQAFSQIATHPEGRLFKDMKLKCVDGKVNYLATFADGQGSKT